MAYLCIMFAVFLLASAEHFLYNKQAQQGSLQVYKLFSPALHEQQLNLTLYTTNGPSTPKSCLYNLQSLNQPLRLLRFCYCFPLHLSLINKATKSWNLLINPCLATHSKRGKLVRIDGVCFCSLTLSHLQASTPG